MTDDESRKLFERCEWRAKIDSLRLLIADIKAWDVEQYMSIPHGLRARIEAALTPNVLMSVIDHKPSK